MTRTVTQGSGSKDAHARSPVRNPGSGLDLAWVRGVRVNASAVERRVAEIRARRGLTARHRAAWFLRAIRCMDLTTLSGDDTPGWVRRLCAEARFPLRPGILDAHDARPRDISVAAVCVYHAYIATAVEALQGSGISVAAVSAGFPAGLSPLALRAAEVRASVAEGAGEIDVVINRGHVLAGDWAALFDEVRTLRDACGDAVIKVILATGELGTLRAIGRAALVCMMAGADFVKTSTGKESVNATLPVGVVMARAIREYHQQTGFRVGLKPAGGIRTANDALDWLLLAREELGADWVHPAHFRLGASSLLGEVARALEACIARPCSSDVGAAQGRVHVDGR